jgi:cell wall-associated NlpC family hydrolase
MFRRLLRLPPTLVLAGAVLSVGSAVASPKTATDVESALLPPERRAPDWSLPEKMSYGKLPDWPLPDRTSYGKQPDWSLPHGISYGKLPDWPLPEWTPDWPRRAVLLSASEPRPRSLGERAATIALRAVGIPYRWGGTSPEAGFDCSGLVHWAYGRLGVEVPHSSYELYETGRKVGWRELRAGDVLVFSGQGHVGLYLGRGQMVHAPYSGKNVEVVPLAGHYGTRLVAARRIGRA